MSHASKPPNDDSTASVSNSTANQGIGTRPVEDLEPHDFSKKIFDQDPPNGQFIQSIKDGLEKPLIINEDDEIIDGVRRWKAADILDWDKIEVQVQSFSDEGEEKRAILRHNDHRTETFSQKVSIALKFEKLVASDMKTKMQKGKGVNESKLDDGDLLLQAARGENNTTRKLAGDRVGWSGEKYRQAKKIWRTAHDGKWPEDNGERQVKSEIQESAKNKLDELDEGDESVHSVFTDLKSQVEKPDRVDWSDIRNHSRYQCLENIEQEVPKPDDIREWKSGFNKTLENYSDSYAHIPSPEYHPLIIFLVEKEGGVNISNDSFAVVDSYSNRRPDSDRLEQLYWDEDLSLAEIAVCYSVTRPVIEYWLREDKIGLKVTDAPNL